MIKNSYLTIYLSIYVLEKGESRKTNMIFGTGDILYCRYDPFYKLFEISK